MWKILQIITSICVLILLIKPDHYDAIRHELYQVWDSIGGESNGQA